MTVTLPTITNLNQVFGKVNIAQWADVDNDEDSDTIAARVTWAISEAADYILGRLTPRFDFSTVTTLPTRIFSLICRRAGMVLYMTPRGLVDGDAAFQQSNATMLRIDTEIEQLLSGQLKLTDGTVVEPRQDLSVDLCTIPGNKNQVDTMIAIGGLPWSSMTTDDSAFYAQ